MKSLLSASRAFLSRWSTVILTALAAAAAALYALKSKRDADAADKWRQRSQDIAGGKVDRNLRDAGDAERRAQFLEQRGREHVEKARKQVDRIGGANEDLASILDGWRSGGVRDAGD